MQSDYKMASTLRDEANVSENKERAMNATEMMVESARLGREAMEKGARYLAENDAADAENKRYMAAKDDVLWLLEKLTVAANIAKMPLLEAYAQKVLNRVKGEPNVSA